MISKQLLDELHKLKRVDKLRVIQLLVGDLAIEEGAYFTDGATYEVWSPFDSPQASEALLQMLEQDQT